MKLPAIGITMGDPAGVGPELCLRVCRDQAVRRVSVPVVFGSPPILARVAAASGLQEPPAAIPLAEWRRRPVAARPIVVDVGCRVPASLRPGRVQKGAGVAARQCVDSAVEDALAGRIAAVVTAPIHKEAWHLAGGRHPGHTEYLAALTGARDFCMTMASERIVVSLVTTHVSLRSVPGLVRGDAVLRTIGLTRDALRGMLGREPRLAVLALNPHGGEHGLMGDEEARRIEPAIGRARARGWLVDGPVAPDTAFLPARIRATDGYVAMYHDQGLIPFKMLAFETGVNVTLGLPIVRVSPDHGTAFDIAWQGRASHSSMRSAVLWAVRLARTANP
jgi:4-hydroxythreonine-4-phosphate dehydrogenase